MRNSDWGKAHFSFGTATRVPSKSQIRNPKSIYCVGKTGGGMGDGNSVGDDGDGVGDGIGLGAGFDCEVGGSTRSPDGTTVVVKCNFSYPTTNDSNA
jgi:hypothetical protein